MKYFCSDARFSFIKYTLKLKRTKGATVFTLLVVNTI